MIIRTLPAGLLNDEVEFFNEPANIEHAYYITGGKVGRVKDAPHWLISIIRNDMAEHPEKMEALVGLGYETDPEQLEKYISCVSGAFDGEPDVERTMIQSGAYDGQPDIFDSKILHTEYWPCPHRGDCPAEGRLCNALVVGPNNEHLTRREIDVLILVAKGLQNKEVADRLNISEETVKVHLKHVFEKSHTGNRSELVLLAHKKNLIS